MSETDSGGPADRLSEHLPILCLVTDLNLVGGDAERVADTVCAAVRGGVNMVQVRAPVANDEIYRDLIEKVVEAANGQALVIANIAGRSLDVASEQVDGFHVPEAEIARLRDLRADVGETCILGASAHSASSALKSVRSSAHYVILGTLFSTASHPDGITQGLPLVCKTTQLIDAPLIGIGGINSGNAASVVGGGAIGIAVIRAISSDHDPRAAASELYDKIQSAWIESRQSGPA